MYRLWQSNHLRNLSQHTLNLIVEVVVIVDDTQMGMTRPSLDYLLIQFAGYTQSLLVGLLVTGGVGGGSIILLGTIGGTHQVQHGIVTLSQSLGVCSCHVGNLLPLFGFDIGRYIHRTSIAYHQHGIFADLGQLHKLVFERQLGFQNGTLALIVQLAVRRKVVPACGAIDSGHFGHIKHLKTITREILGNLYQRGSLTSTRTSCQNNFLNIWH